MGFGEERSQGNKILGGEGMGARRTFLHPPCWFFNPYAVLYFKKKGVGKGGGGEGRGKRDREIKKRNEGERLKREDRKRERGGWVQPKWLQEGKCWLCMYDWSLGMLLGSVEVHWCLEYDPFWLGGSGSSSLSHRRWIANHVRCGVKRKRHSCMYWSKLPL